MRFYSPEWVAAFNEAVAGVAVDPEASFRLVQVVRTGPGGTFSVALTVGDGRVVLERDPGDEPPPQVTVVVSYDDAAALARGEVAPAQLLAGGRVKVRGDLSVLVRGQSVLVEATGQLADLSSSTNY